MTPESERQDLEEDGDHVPDVAEADVDRREEEPGAECGQERKRMKSGASRTSAPPGQVS